MATGKAKAAKKSKPAKATVKKATARKKATAAKKSANIDANAAPQNLAKALYLTHYGASWLDDPVDEAPAVAPTMPLDWSKVEAFLLACEAAHVTYGLGAKVPSDTSVPGKDFTQVDCSGFVRAAVRRATTPLVPFPDGSVVQHEWVRTQGYAAGSVADGKLTDSKVRIAFLDPHDSSDKIGHVVLICNGKTAESHGGAGPDSRPFDGVGWQAKTAVYLLTS